MTSNASISHSKGVSILLYLKSSSPIFYLDKYSPSIVDATDLES